jgi:hypothetical protein
LDALGSPASKGARKSRRFILKSPSRQRLKLNYGE